MIKQTFFVAVLYLLLINLAHSQEPQNLAQIVSAGSYKQQFSKRIFVDANGDGKHYYDGTITNKNDQIQIQIVDEELQSQCLTFKTDNCIKFIDSTKNIILVKEVSSQGKLLAFYVISILFSQKDDKYYLDFFSVHSNVDDEFFDLTKVVGFKINQILEYDQQNQWIAVLVTADIPKAAVVYKINVRDKINVLITVSVFLRNDQVITGGNSKVLYDSNKNTFLVDTHSCRAKVTDGTIFKKVQVCELTKLQLYSNNRVVNLIGWWFQYVSRSNDKKSLTGFVYSGYGDQSIQGQVNLKSNNAIAQFYDEYNFYIAITHCQVYVTNVYWDNQKSNYNIFSGTVSNQIDKQNKYDDYYSDWSSSLDIIFINRKFYILTKNKFIVIGTQNKRCVKIYELSCSNNITKDSQTSLALLKQIKIYKSRKQQSDDKDYGKKSKKQESDSGKENNKWGKYSNKNNH